MKPMFITLALLATAAHAGAPMTADGPHPDAPEQLKQYGQLQGDWLCRGSNPQPDGSWQENPNPPASWSWYYVLDGYAIQDVWKPGDGKSPWGTNLRTYDAETGKWNMVWATQQQARFDEFSAEFVDGNIVMTGQRWARPAFQAHTARITFHNIQKEHFDWKYEVAAADGSWSEFSRLSCDRDNP
ncbi:MAG: hypothetical protein QNJ40_09770 [Xanthomonadales bacterium]|nr:hypothetical protein [Xanthomonadales bacterium]